MRLTLRQKLVIGFSLAFCGIIAGFGVLVLHNNGERYQRQSYAYCRRIVQANIDLTDNYFEQLRNVVRIVVSDQDIINAVNYRVHNPDIDYSIELYNQRKVAAKIKQFDVLGDVKNAIIVGPGGEYLYYYGTSLARGYAFGEQAWFSGAVGTNRMEFINYHPTDYLLGSTGEQTVSLVAPILNSSQYFLADPAYLLCDFSLEPILGDPGRDGEVQIAVYSGSDPVYVPAQLGLAGAQQAQLAAYIEAGERSFLLDACPENASGYLVVSETSEVSGWLILGVMPLDSIQELRSTNRTFVAVLMLVAFAVILAVSSLLARSVLVPMNTLIQKFNAIGRGEKDVRFEKTASVEVDRIAETAMQMLEKNDRLTAEVVEEGRLASMLALLPQTLTLPGGGTASGWYIYALATDPGARSKGYGRQLLRFVDGYLAGIEEPGLGVRYMGSYDALSARLDEVAVDEVVVALEADEIELLPHVFAACDKNGVRITMVPFYSDYLPARPTIDVLDECKLINVRQTPFDNLLNAAVKRGLDIIGSLILIILTSPVMLVTAIGVKLSSPGPIIFKQERVGLNKRPFMMYKFRSMRVNAAEDSAWSTNSDPRKTRFGSIIRKFSLDELPQFFNVLKGDMSLVGPRPEIPFHVEHFKEEIPRYLVRQQVRPGLTGWAQINGLRGDTDIAERIRYDIWYIENWTVALDIKILFRTVFGGKMVNDEKIQ